MQSAKNAGVNFIGLTCGYGNKDDFKNAVNFTDFPYDAVKIAFNS